MKTTKEKIKSVYRDWPKTTVQLSCAFPMDVYHLSIRAPAEVLNALDNWETLTGLAQSGKGNVKSSDIIRAAQDVLEAVTINQKLFDGPHPDPDFHFTLKDVSKLVLALYGRDTTLGNAHAPSAAPVSTSVG